MLNTFTISLLAVAFLLWNTAAGVAAPLQWQTADGGNGHYYEHVATGPLTWNEANDRAQSMSYMGVQGHLLTTTTQAELEFIQNNLLNPSHLDWIGGYQDRKVSDYAEPAGGWRWVTGEPFDFTAWSTPAIGGNDTEPNNYGGIEDVMSTEPGKLGDQTILGWNDLPANAELSGFYVEFVPEPSTLALLGVGFVALLACRLQRYRSAIKAIVVAVAALWPANLLAAQIPGL